MPLLPSIPPSAAPSAADVSFDIIFWLINHTEYKFVLVFLTTAPLWLLAWANTVLLAFGMECLFFFLHFWHFSVWGAVCLTPPSIQIDGDAFVHNNIILELKCFIDVAFIYISTNF